jgi:hypothetical protein
MPGGEGCPGGVAAATRSAGPGHSAECRRGGVPDMGAARAFMGKEPFYSNGVYQEVTFQRWRFGRLMDRFKERIAGHSGRDRTMIQSSVTLVPPLC